ncbi:sulfate abc permease : Sulfate ABC transporter, permease CysW OS=Acinetobacter nectaris CIP 110549 GN=P256_00304 PE=4 SV=1: BPD_transp_1 [Gemmata massiliana]|uniref:ABC transmembrane type-1 domain-containing protein n=1 Tax=Gemmata massiliana TaxID=1210884 RepID=A0A6P2D3V9_9BACT|nr:sulfate ABC transporter permease subunit CysW [Gemmata massiliana]VTR95557.1 sulfate abc permease : Sulfate ABC transporter, permease CysW OS=Acinetobacter nectaris CIP 110549 GN=P256_00304 PE=4 SV=1: BPD_transp_1 [Gemmata massiliana]
MTPTETARRAARRTDPLWVRIALTSLALLALTVLVVIPVLGVFAEAFADGVGAYWTNLTADADTRHSVLLTLTVAPLAVLCNLIFGIAAAWAITRFKFPGRTLLVTLIDVPFSVSPVVVGLMFVILFAAWGVLGPWLDANGFRVLGTVPALVLVTTFVTLPFVARELIPVMEAIGPDEELAALSLGANGRQIFWRITLPNIKWGLLYGVILCNARAMGEFGAVYVVSGRIAGETCTMPLQVEVLFQDFNSPAAFALASVLTMLAVVTLLLKVWVEGKKSSTAEGTGGAEIKNASEN